MARTRWIERLAKRSVIVHLSDGASMRAVLLRSHPDCMVLVEARYLSPDGQETAVDGEIVIPRQNVSWLQVTDNVEGIK